VLVLFAPAASAGGYFYSDSGIVATGRGGAFVAGADNQFAQYYNPAGLIRVEDPTVNVGWSGVQQGVTFRRAKPDGGFYAPVENEAGPFDVPEIGFVTPLGDRVALAVGFYSPFAPSSLYPEEGPQRYSIKDTLIYQFSIGPSAAFRVHEMLTLGVGLQWTYLQVGETVDVTVSGIDDPAGDIAVEARVDDPFTPNANAGLLFEPHQAISFGFAAQPPTVFSARGTGSLDFTGSALEPLLTQSRYVDEDVALALGIPWVLRGGVAVRPLPERDLLEVEVAVVWQDWSSLDDLVISDIDVRVESDSPFVPEDQRQVDDTIALPAGLKDTVSLRLGAESRLNELLEVRAGGFWESAALAEDEVSVTLVDTPKVQLGGGASVHLLDDRLKLDAAFAWLFFESLRIRDSTVTQIDAGVFDDTVPLVVGNGDLSAYGWVLGLGASWSFKGKDAGEGEA
jgi:long-chain fatty acid transport protein